MKRLFVICLFILLWPESSLARELLLGDQQDVYSFDGHYQLLKDPAGKLTFEEVSELASQGAFKAVDAVSSGYTDQVTWVRMVLSNRVTDSHIDSSTDSNTVSHIWYLRMLPPMLDNLQVYVQPDCQQQHKQSVQFYQLGDYFSYAQRHYRHSSFLVPIDLTHCHRATIYARIETSGATMFRASMIYDSQLPATINNTAIITGTFIGIAVIVVVIYLLFWRYLQESVYLYYALYILSVLLLFISIKGVTIDLVPAMSGVVNDRLILFSTNVETCLFISFLIRLFPVRETFLRVYRILQVVWWIGLIASLLAIAGLFVPFAKIYYPVMLALLVITMLISLYYVFQGLASARFYFAALLAALLGGAIALLRALGFLPVNVWTDNAYYLGGLVHMVLLNIGLMNRVRIIQLQKQNAEARAREVLADSERRATQLALERTHELSEAKERLELTLNSERQAHEEQSRLLAMMSHEYRTPISVIKGAVELIDRWVTKEPERQTVLNRIRRSVDRLVEVIETGVHKDQLLSKGSAILKRPIDISSLLLDVCHSARLMMEPREIRLSTQPGEDLPCNIEGDESLLKTALLNLIENAHKFSPPESAIEIDYHVRDESVIISVSDHGRGVEEAELPRLFDRYWRGSNVTGVAGTGMGLYLVREIVHSHGGEVFAANRDQGGFSVTVSLPASTGK